MKRILIASMLFSMLACPALALQKPELSTFDRRVEFATYNENEVYSVHAIKGLITTIVFAEDEEVLNYGSGFSTAWEFAARGNHFFLKPKGEEGTTNLVVVTNKRTYLFDVRLGWNRKTATYRLTFQYPHEQRAKAVAEAETQVVNGLLQQSSVPATKESQTATHSINRHYTMNFGRDRGSKDIAPIKAFDNGEFTYLKFKKSTDFPAVYRVVTGKEESLLNSHVEGEHLVIHGVYKRLHLRAGQAVVGIYNESYNGTGNTTTTGVTVPGLSRVIKGK